MKFYYFLLILAFVVLLAGCSEGPINSSYQPVLPAQPEHWQEVLGEPHWRLEWVNESGVWQECDLSPGSVMPGISLPNEWTTAVLAWPFWPSWNLTPGQMRPSGALFPWDAAGGKLRMSWMGGVEAFFWKGLAAADRPNPASDPKSPLADGRLPWYFDWPRFRELLSGENIPEAVRQDPWLADWKEISRKTVLSGFDRRRIVARKFTVLAIPGLDGVWAGSSPFASPLTVPSDSPLLLNTDETPDTWVSGSGILKCSSAGWVLIPHR
ncbi:MAG: hypothetical protein LBH42_07570 [Treponema sp.]|jgi:hypothetical protein|nr:hypothetical protein [Treponema sp.]